MALLPIRGLAAISGVLRPRESAIWQQPSSVKFVTPPKVEISVSKLIELNVIIQSAGRPFDIHQDVFARFRETIFWARSMKARKLAAMWRRPG
jgi:hypothetical protein